VTIVLHFPLPAKCLTMNQRLHWAQKAKLTARWREATWAAVMDAYGGGRGDRDSYRVRSVVQLVLPVRSLKIRRDPHNWFPTVKACVDGLVDAGLWPDDTSEYVVTVEPRFHLKVDVELHITPASEWVAS
jgi:hypothetical protein